MRTSTITSALLAIAFCASPALADDHHDRDRGRDHRTPHGAYARNPHQHGPYRDSRGGVEIRNDPHFRMSVNGYRPHRSWRRYHQSRGAWFRTFGIRTWVGVGAVTCEAVNQDTGQMYPVSVATAFNDSSVNLALDQALDNCYADGGGAACVPIQPACSLER